MLREPPREPSTAGRRVEAACAGLTGRRLAIDLDGTLIDQAVAADRETGRRRLVIQVRPGAEALVRALAPRNELLLYTAREASQVAQVLARRPGLRDAFLPDVPPGEQVRTKDVLRSPACFTLADWLAVMEEVLARGLERPDDLDPLDRSLLELVRLYARAPGSLLHLKLPELAARRGKRGFDVIVDDSPGLADLLGRVGSDVGRVHLPPAEGSRDPDGLDQMAHDALVQAAELLPGVGRGDVARVGEVRPLAEEPLVRFVVEPDVPQEVERALERVERLRQRWLA